MLTLPLQKLAFIIERAREFEAEVPADCGDTDSNPTDDQGSGILLDTPDNSTVRELRDAIDGLNTDEQEELLALMWIGRGDFTRNEWAAAIRQARQSRTTSEPGYLIGTPLLSDYLEEGVDARALARTFRDGTALSRFREAVPQLSGKICDKTKN